MADVAYFVRDLLFSSKIREAAAQLGLKTQSAATPAALVELAAGARLIVIDLRLDQSLAALEAVRAEPALHGVRTVGFVDHERVDVMDAARARGCDEVLTKGQVTRELPRLLAR